MILERAAGRTCRPPFPVHPDLAGMLAAGAAPLERDPVAAHALAICASYAYADLDTFATMTARIGFEAEACLRVAQTVDAMLVHSTAYLLQSRCGRVAILSYRGTEATNVGNWLGDTDVGCEPLCPGEDLPPLGVHAGFHLNMRATWLPVVEELEWALEGRSILDPARPVPHPLEALYVTGHSLGGAMALLFALGLEGRRRHRPLARTLRAVYTYGQPMALCHPPPPWADEVTARLLRHVLPRDPVPALPPAAWGSFVHVGQEYRFEEGVWRRAELPVAQLENPREIARSIFDTLGPTRRRGLSRYSAGEHVPHHYLAALRPAGRITELGD